MPGHVPKLPQAACSSCHTRKIKCDRRPGSCSACSKIQLSCRYPTSEQILKRRAPRGPYKKRKSHRERELEDLVKTMTERCNELEDAANAALNRSLRYAGSPDSSLDLNIEEYHNEVRESLSPKSVVTSTYSGSSSAECPDSSRRSLPLRFDPGPVTPGRSERLTPELVSCGLSGPQTLELWHIYRTQIDPVTKLIHCPSFSAQILLALSRPSIVDSCLEMLVFSICYAAVDVLSAGEVETRFQQKKDVLASCYKKGMERALGEAASRQMPSLHVLQALVLHAICLFRRSGDGAPTGTALLDMAVSEACLLLPENGSSYHDNLSVLETQLLLRCWWALYALDYHRAAKCGCDPSASLQSKQVALPLNLNDIDLSPNMQQLPVPRTSVTEMSYFLVVVELTLLDAVLPQLQASEPESEHFKSLGSIINERTMLNPVEIQMLEMGQIIYSTDKLLDCAASAALSEKTFSLALDVTECWYILKTHPNLSAWSWYTDIFRRRYDADYIKAKVAELPESEERTRAQTLLVLDRASNKSPAMGV
ncbi:hypothetical protein AYL99_09627 [Fonsecaea erecta]|uniref:Zn(2)-C6 fungal-type domain-containing protein n=1 Tax=Fonsecaea erecta TaxID=1367422 RepID=A0A178Z9H3_9EURO|nr:hypothetical protein AYL99_09627 [Fonsecaea erecta]OAP56448.1 hypothetical protein AYL99_09627 [Fonsecaea erecta]